MQIEKKVSLKDTIFKRSKICKKCVNTNQRPRISFDENVCSACNFADFKNTEVDWEKETGNS